MHVSIPDTGRVFPNLSLQGLRSADSSDTEITMSTWDFHDPNGASYDLLHAMAICMWCPHCNNETGAVVAIADWQASHRVAVLQIALQGYGSDSPTWPDVQRWANSHTVGFPVLIDGQGAELGQYFNLDSVPVNIMVNPRDMSVLGIDVGEEDDAQSYEQGYLNRL